MKTLIKAQATRIIGILLLELAAGPVWGQSWEPPAQFAKAPFEARISAARDHYDRVENASYRTALFALYREMTTKTPTVMLAELEVLLTEGQRDHVDGLELLIVAYADAITRVGTASQQTTLRARLTAARDRLRYRFQKPWATQLVPFGRRGERVIFDVRPEVGRTLLAELLRQPGRARLDLLMTGSTLQNDLCALPAVAPHQIGLYESLAAADPRRQVFCEQRRANGGNADGAATLAGIGVSACLDANLEDFKLDDEYTVEEMENDLQACTNDLAAYGGGHPLAGAPAGPVVARELLPLLPIIGESVGKTTETAVGKVIDHVVHERQADNAQAREQTNMDLAASRKEREQAAQAADADRRAIAKASGNLLTAELNLSTAEKNLIETQNDVRALEKAIEGTRALINSLSVEGAGWSDQEKQTQKNLKENAEKKLDSQEKQLESLKGELSKKKEEKTQAEIARNTALGEMKTALEAAKKSNEDTPEEGALFESAACTRLMTSGRFSDPGLALDRLPKDWADWSRRWKNVEHPRPDDPGRPGDVLGLPSCGADAPTSTWAGNACNALIHCTSATTQCGCGTGPDSLELTAQKLAVSESALSCAATVCQPGLVPHPAEHGLCGCVPPESSEVKVKPRPLPVGLRAVAETFLSTTMPKALPNTPPLDQLGEIMSVR